MFYRLKERYLLRGWEKLPYAVVDRESARTIFVSAVEMEALQLCNGKINSDLPLIDPKIREMIPVIEKNGFIEPCERGDALLPEQEYRLYPSRYIRTAHWSVTGKCNYRCRHCYMSAPDAKLGELPHGTVMGMIDDLARCGVMEVSLTGGEPLVRDDFMEIVDRLLEKGIRIRQIYSNGALVDEKLLRALDGRGVRPEFNMSFDGVGWHDWLRGVDGAEALVDRAFRLCRDMGFPTGAELCIHQGNKHLLRESVCHLRDVGCGSLKTNPVANTGEWLKGGYGESIGFPELLQIYLDYIPLFYEDGMPLSLMLGGFFSASPRHPDRFDVPLYHPAEDPRTCCVCNHARMVMYISPEGRALPCMSLSGADIQHEFPLVQEIGLEKCLTDSRYMEFIDTRADKVLAHNPECAACRWKAWCLGGCRACGLESSGQTDLLYRDLSACELFRGGWIRRLVEKMREIRPEAKSVVLSDEAFIAALEEPDTP